MADPYETETPDLSAKPLEKGTVRVSAGSTLSASAERVWVRVTTMAGVNAEFRPILRMTSPRHLRDATIADLKPGVPAGRSWLLLFGLLPVDYDDLCLAEIEPPRRFLERSTMLSMELWQHERIIEPADGGGCTITDNLEFRLRGFLARIPGAAAISRRIITAIFGYRHHRLRSLYGEPGAL